MTRAFLDDDIAESSDSLPAEGVQGGDGDEMALVVDDASEPDPDNWADRCDARDCCFRLLVKDRFRDVVHLFEATERVPVPSLGRGAGECGVVAGLRGRPTFLAARP